MKKIILTEKTLEMELRAILLRDCLDAYSRTDFTQNLINKIIEPIISVSEALKRNLTAIFTDDPFYSSLFNTLDLTISETILRIADFKPVFEILDFSAPFDFDTKVETNEEYLFALTSLSKESLLATLSTNLKELDCLNNLIEECLIISAFIIKTIEQSAAHDERIITLQNKILPDMSSRDTDSIEEEISTIKNKIIDKYNILSAKLEELKSKLLEFDSLKETENVRSKIIASELEVPVAQNYAIFNEFLKKEIDDKARAHYRLKKIVLFSCISTLVVAALSYSHIKLYLKKKMILKNSYAQHFLTKFHIERINSSKTNDALYKATFESLKKGKESKLTDLIKSVLKVGFPLNFSSKDRGLIELSIPKSTLLKYSGVFGKSSKLKLVFIADIKEPQDFFNEDLKFEHKIFKLKDLCQSNKKVSLIADIDSPFDLISPYLFPAKGINISDVMRASSYCR